MNHIFRTPGQGVRKCELCNHASDSRVTVTAGLPGRDVAPIRDEPRKGNTMHRHLLTISLAATLATLLTPTSADAYYHANLGRFLTRDPIEHAGSKWNLYEYVNGRPMHLTDPFGMVPGVPVPPIPGETIPWPEPPHPGPVTPAGSDSPICDQYDCDDTYSGANAKCFCKCAGDSPWSNYVRGCLRKLYNQGVDPNNAHIRCYAAADKKRFEGGRPVLTLARCYVKCTLLHGYDGILGSGDPPPFWLGSPSL